MCALQQYCQCRNTRYVATYNHRTDCAELLTFNINGNLLQISILACVLGSAMTTAHLPMYAYMYVCMYKYVCTYVQYVHSCILCWCAASRCNTCECICICYTVICALTQLVSYEGCITHFHITQCFFMRVSADELYIPSVPIPHALHLGCRVNTGGSPCVWSSCWAFSFSLHPDTSFICIILYNYTYIVKKVIDKVYVLQNKI